MGIPVLLIGKSGSGKSASLRNFKENEVGIINVLNKPLPFKNSLKFYATDDCAKVRNAIFKSKTASLVIDDAGYLMTNMFMRGHSEYMPGDETFRFYNTIADNFWNLVEAIKALPDNKIVYLIMHEDKNDFGDIKPKSIGKLLDNKVCIEGLFTIVLRAVKENNDYLFLTKSRGFDVTKTPMGMFDAETIENDLKAVDKAIREYYQIETNSNNESEDAEKIVA